MPNAHSKTQMAGPRLESSEVELQLMRRLCAGEHEAMDELVHRFGPRIHRVVGRLTGWSTETDDIVQEVFLTAWQKADQFEGRGSLDAWLRRLAVNRTHNHHRARKAFRNLIDRFHDWLSNRGRTDHATELPDVGFALSRLSELDRTALVLFYLEGLTGQEVASDLGISVKSLHMRLSRARLRLKKILLQGERND